MASTVERVLMAAVARVPSILGRDAGDDTSPVTPAFEAATVDGSDDMESWPTPPPSGSPWRLHKTRDPDRMSPATPSLHPPVSRRRVRMPLLVLPGCAAEPAAVVDDEDAYLPIQPHSAPAAASAPDTRAIVGKALMRLNQSVEQHLHQAWLLALSLSCAPQRVTKVAYRCLFSVVRRWLSPEQHPDTIQQWVETDWENDAVGLPSMDRDVFMDALFELVEVWVYPPTVARCTLFLDEMLGVLNASQDIKQRQLRDAAAVSQCMSEEQEAARASQEAMVRKLLDVLDPDTAAAAPPSRMVRARRSALATGTSNMQQAQSLLAGMKTWKALLGTLRDESSTQLNTVLTPLLQPRHVLFPITERRHSDSTVAHMPLEPQTARPSCLSSRPGRRLSAPASKPVRIVDTTIVEEPVLSTPPPASNPPAAERGPRRPSTPFTRTVDLPQPQFESPRVVQLMRLPSRGAIVATSIKNIGKLQLGISRSASKRDSMFVDGSAAKSYIVKAAVNQDTDTDGPSEHATKSLRRAPDSLFDLMNVECDDE